MCLTYARTWREVGGAEGTMAVARWCGRPGRMRRRQLLGQAASPRRMDELFITQAVLNG
jgi:hypothetical protein